jgi:hypothetical protein
MLPYPTWHENPKNMDQSTEVENSETQSSKSRINQIWNCTRRPTILFFNQPIEQLYTNLLMILKSTAQEIRTITIYKTLQITAIAPYFQVHTEHLLTQNI